MANIPTFKPTMDNLNNITNALEHYGCVIVEHPPTYVYEYQKELEHAFESIPYGKEDDPKAFYPSFTKRIAAGLTRLPSTRKLVTNELALKLTENVLKENCSSFRLHVCSGLNVGPGARDQILHREDDTYPFFPVPRPKLIVASMIAISDFYPENGGTQIVPGSHKWKKGRRAKPEEVVRATMATGSQLFWMGGTLHAGGANVTKDTWRKGLFISYNLGWLRQEEEQLLQCPPEVAKDFSPILQDLIGYKMHESGLGFFDPRIATAANKRKKQNIEELQGQSIVNLNETSNSKL